MTQPNRYGRYSAHMSKKPYELITKGDKESLVGDLQARARRALHEIRDVSEKVARVLNQLGEARVMWSKICDDEQHALDVLEVEAVQLRKQIGEYKAKINEIEREFDRRQLLKEQHEELSTLMGRFQRLLAATESAEEEPEARPPIPALMDAPVELPSRAASLLMPEQVSLSRAASPSHQAVSPTGARTSEVAESSIVPGSVRQSRAASVESSADVVLDVSASQWGSVSNLVTGPPSSNQHFPSFSKAAKVWDVVKEAKGPLDLSLRFWREEKNGRFSCYPIGTCYACGAKDHLYLRCKLRDEVAYCILCGYPGVKDANECPFRNVHSLDHLERLIDLQHQDRTTAPEEERSEIERGLIKPPWLQNVRPG